MYLFVCISKRKSFSIIFVCLYCVCFFCSLLRFILKVKFLVGTLDTGTVNTDFLSLISFGRLWSTAATPSSRSPASTSTWSPLVSSSSWTSSSASTGRRWRSQWWKLSCCPQVDNTLSRSSTKLFYLGVSKGPSTQRCVMCCKVFTSKCSGCEIIRRLRIGNLESNSGLTLLVVKWNYVKNHQLCNPLFR